MWVEKTEEEIIEEEKFKPSFVAPILIFLLPLILFIMNAIGISRSIVSPKPMKFDEFIVVLPLVILASLCLGTIVYYLQKWSRKNYFTGKERTVFICEKCFRTKNDDNNYNCTCGEKYVDIKKMKWIEDEE